MRDIYFTIECNSLGHKAGETIYPIKYVTHISLQFLTISNIYFNDMFY